MTKYEKFRIIPDPEDVVLLKTPSGYIRNKEKYVLACISLPNYLMQTNCAKYLPFGFFDCADKNGTIKPGEWRSVIANSRAPNGCLQTICSMRGCRQREEVLKMREAIMVYLNTEAGSVLWQNDYVRRTFS